MKRHHVVERDFVAGMNVAQRVEEYVVVEDFHVAVGLAGMVDVMRAVTPAAAVYAPIAIDGADAQHAAIMRSTLCFGIGYQLARVLGDFSAAPERDGSKASLAVDFRFPHGETFSESYLHGKEFGRPRASLQATTGDHVFELLSFRLISNENCAR